MRKVGRSDRRNGPCNQPAWRPSVLSLEDRTLLAVDFTGGAQFPPDVNRVDIQLGMPAGTTEPIVKINPNDPGVLVISNQAQLVTSQDAGGTFSAVTPFGNFLTTLTVPTQPNPTLVNSPGGDTDTAFDADGRLYWTNLARTTAVPFTPPRGVAVVEINPASPNTQIGTTQLIPNNGQNDDKQFLAADTDPFGTSPFRNNVYAVWTRLGGSPSGAAEVMFSRFTPGAAGWSAPIQLSNALGPDGIAGNADDEGFIWPSDVAVGPTGDVYVVYHSQPSNGPAGVDGANPDGVSGQIFLLRSTDGGVTFPEKYTVLGPGNADITANVQTTTGAIPGSRFWMLGAGQPFVLVDPVRPGNIYVIANDDPDNTPGSGDDGDVIFARSTDFGQTWTSTTLSAGPNNSLQVFPTAAIDRFGRIVVAWYDNRSGAVSPNGDRLIDVYATYSVNGGATWAQEFQINDVPLDPVTPNTAVRFGGADLNGVNGNTDIDGDETFRIGEYFGIDIFGGTAYVAFNGNTFGGGGLPLGHDTYLDAFAVPGNLIITGDEAGVTNDDFLVRRVAGNTDFVEFFLNGQREYVGLMDGLFSVELRGLGGNDTLTIDFTNGDPTETLGDFLFDGGSGFDVVIVPEFDGDMDLFDDPVGIGAQPATLVFVGEGSIALDEVEGADLTGSFRPNRIDTSQFTLGQVRLRGLASGDTLIGGPGNDFIEGGNATDELFGGGGNDTIVGGNADLSAFATGDGDLIFGQGGDDLIIGDDGLPGRLGLPEQEGGDDTLVGGDGNDTIYGLLGNDAIQGDRGADVIYGGSGNDLILAGVPLGPSGTNFEISADRVEGGDGNDLIFGDAANIFNPELTNLALVGGDDTLLGDAGDDIIFGTGGNDLIEGGLGNDSLYGGNGNDSIVGGLAPEFPDLLVDSGDDVIDGGEGADVLLGDNGTAAPLGVDGGFLGGDDTILGSGGNDVIYGQAGQDVLDGGEGNDLIHGGRNADVVLGQTGNDTLLGEGGSDTLEGGDGNDSISGGSGDDFARGGDGQDTLGGQSGDDLLLGEAGRDQINGFSGRDILLGGEAIDQLDGEAGEDILIGGTTTFDEDDEALVAIWEEWRADRDFFARQANLIDGTGSADPLNDGSFLVEGVTVIDDAFSDDLDGGLDLNWLLVS